MQSPAQQSSPVDAVRPSEVAARLFVAVAVAGLTLFAQGWALHGDLADEEARLSVPVAALVGLSAFLAWMPAPLLLRAACHLAAVWFVRETLGSSWSHGTSLGVFLAASLAFFGTLAVGSVDSLGQGGESSPRRLRWTTGELLSLLFAAGAYAAIARQELPFLGSATLEALRIAILHAFVPFAALCVATRLAGRLGGSLAICSIAVAVAFLFPIAAPCDPFAVALVVALSALADRGNALGETDAVRAVPAT